MLKIDFTMFFDRATVQRAVRDGTKSTLSKIGAFIQTAARRSMRRRKKSAAPGTPPSAHVGLLRDRTFFGYDAGSGSVVVGPQLLNSKTSPTIPEALEYGKVLKMWKTGRPTQYSAFPFMRPAEQSVRTQYPQMFRDAIR